MHGSAGRSLARNTWISFQSNEGSFIAFATFLAKNWPHVRWFPWFNCGMPYEFTYLPLVPALVALGSWITATPPRSRVPFHCGTYLFSGAGNSVLLCVCVVAAYPGRGSRGTSLVLILAVGDDSGDPGRLRLGVWTAQVSDRGLLRRSAAQCSNLSSAPGVDLRRPLPGAPELALVRDGGACSGGP